MFSNKDTFRALPSDKSAKRKHTQLNEGYLCANRLMTKQQRTFREIHNFQLATYDRHT